MVAGSYIGSKMAKSAVSDNDPSPVDDAARGDKGFVEDEYYSTIHHYNPSSN